MVYPIHGFYVNSGSNQVQREICSLFPVDAQEDSEVL
jgi:hypothetical protein